MSLVLAFYKGTRAENDRATLWDRLICWWPASRGRFSHCELAAQPVLGTNWHCLSASPRDGGVRATTIDLASGRWILVALPYHNGQAAREWIQARIGRRYDWLGVLGFVLPWIRGDRGRLYCSEACALAIRAGASNGHLPLEWPRARIAPSALYAWARDQVGAKELDLANLAGRED